MEEGGDNHLLFDYMLIVEIKKGGLFRGLSKNL
jgi:hypothetical protein